MRFISCQLGLLSVLALIGGLLLHSHNAFILYHLIRAAELMRWFH